MRASPRSVEASSFGARARCVFTNLDSACRSRESHVENCKDDATLADHDCPTVNGSRFVPENMQTALAPRRRRSSAAALPIGAAVACHAGLAHGSFLTGEALDTAADVMSWVVLVLVPIVAIAVFWIVHVLPEKIAHKRHHPQTQAIQVLCLLSLVFGGLLWPIAWIWAYTRPVAHKLAYGTDKGEEYFVELGDRARKGEALEHELAALKHELDGMHARGTLPAHLARLREELAAQPALAAAAAPSTERELTRRSA